MSEQLEYNECVACGCKMIGGEDAGYEPDEDGKLVKVYACQLCFWDEGYGD